jgi:hypothetical protein
VGLDAFVHCRCWQDGLAPLPSSLDGVVGFDEEGWLSLLPEHDDDERYGTFVHWRKSSCPHDAMRIANEHVSNWGGYRLFQAALADAGWDHFPTLRSELPNANGGQTDAKQAALMFAELDHFSRRTDLPDDVVLLDEATGDVVMEHIGAYDGVLMLGPGYRAGIDPEGFFVLDPDTDPRATVFRSMRFRQEVLGDKRVRFSDDERTVEVDMPPVGERPGVARQPERLRLGSRPRDPARYADIVETLQLLCRASVQTRNPVLWT